MAPFLYCLLYIMIMLAIFCSLKAIAKSKGKRREIAKEENKQKTDIKRWINED